jgi:uncharacterized protein
MSALKILMKHYGPGALGENAGEALLKHSGLVAEKALVIAEGLGLSDDSLAFLREGALIHDIGIYLTRAPELGCTGNEPYIRHGVLGRGLIEAEGLHELALVCERHVGAGITAREIESSGLPLPARDMLPLSIEEKIICVADKFFRKTGTRLELTLEEARQTVARYGPGPAGRFDSWLEELGLGS